MSNDKEWLDKRLKHYKGREPGQKLKARILSNISKRDDKADTVNFMIVFERRVFASFCLALILGLGTAVYSSNSSAKINNLHSPFYPSTTILMAETFINEGDRR